MAKNQILFHKEQSFWAKHRIKIASTFVAIFIWFFVVSGNTYEYVTTIPLQIPTPNENFVITNELPQDAHIEIQGQGKAMLSFMLFKEGRMRLNIDWKAGKQIIKLSEQDILLTGNAKNLTIRKLVSPDTLLVHIEEIGIKKVAVENHTTIKPQPGYTVVGNILIEPPFVEIQGPKSVLDSLNSIATIEKDFLDIKYQLQEKVALQQPQIQHVTLLNSQVTLGVDVQKLLEKKLENIPVQVRNIPQNMNAFVIPAQLSLYIQGGVDLVFNLSAKDIHAFIDYESRTDTLQTDYPVFIEPIEQVRFRDITPDRFKIVMERIEP